MLEKFNTNVKANFDSTEKVIDEAHKVDPEDINFATLNVSIDLSFLEDEKNGFYTNLF